MRPGVRLAVDVGTVRVGLARSDAGGILALPLETLPRQDDASEIKATHESLRWFYLSVVCA